MLQFRATGTDPRTHKPGEWIIEASDIDQVRAELQSLGVIDPTISAIPGSNRNAGRTTRRGSRRKSRKNKKKSKLPNIFVTIFAINGLLATLPFVFAAVRLPDNAGTTPDLELTALQMVATIASLLSLPAIIGCLITVFFIRKNASPIYGFIVFGIAILVNGVSLWILTTALGLMYEIVWN